MRNGLSSRWNSAVVIAATILICAAVAFVAWYVGAQPRTGAPPRASASPALVPFTRATGVRLPSASTSPAPLATTLRPRTNTAVPSRAPTPTAGPTALNAGATPAPMPIEHPLATIRPGAMPPVVRQPPDAPPQIIAFRLSSPVVQGGDVVSGMVETSSNVASVEARIGGYGASMEKVGVGRFALSYRVPNLPFFLHRTFMVQIIARNTRGQAVSTAIPLTIR